MTDGYPPNPAPELVARGADLEELAEAADACRSCHLYQDATQAVFGEGPGSTTYLMVGEQPGDQEDRRGREVWARYLPTRWVGSWPIIDSSSIRSDTPAWVWLCVRR